MDWLHVVALAVIQGLTEFLPISSSAHLILPSQLLGWPDQGLAFDVAVHVGSLAAVVLAFHREVAHILRDWVAQCRGGPATPESRLGWAVIVAGLTFVAMLPAFLGLFFVLPLLGHGTWHLYRQMVEAGEGS